MGWKGKIFKFMSGILKDGSYYTHRRNLPQPVACQRDFLLLKRVKQYSITVKRPGVSYLESGFHCFYTYKLGVMLYLPFLEGDDGLTKGSRPLDSLVVAASGLLGTAPEHFPARSSAAFVKKFSFRSEVITYPSDCKIIKYYKLLL